MDSKREQILDLAGTMGVFRPRDLSAIGVSPAYLRRLLTDGVVSRTARGLYTLAEFDLTEAHTLVEAIRAQSNGVVCLASALRFHGIGTQLPARVWVAVPFGSRITKREWPPMRAVVMRPPAYGQGIEVHQLEGVDVPVYGVAKTVADCFKFRNTVGLDVALEALREVLRDRRCSREEIRQYARIDRVENVIRPYMEALAI
jgi:predicted transcriptional regulator of viral defense system